MSESFDFNAPLPDLHLARGASPWQTQPLHVTDEQCAQALQAFDHLDWSTYPGPPPDTYPEPMRTTLRANVVAGILGACTGRTEDETLALIRENPAVVQFAAKLLAVFDTTKKQAAARLS